MFNSSIPDVEYVHIRDFENGFLYAGWVNAFSETDKLRELILLDVVVYNLDGIERYRVPRLYIARTPENAHIEFPYNAASTSWRYGNIAMSNEKERSKTVTMDGFSKVQPLHEGYLAKGGLNNTSQIRTRPPAPPVLTRPAGATAAAVPARKPKT